jgi:hypothetical protein
MPADITISALSTEYVQVPVQAMVAGSPYNPTADVVQFSFVPSGSAAPGSWNTGSWDTTVNDIYLAQCLVGPGSSGVVLAQGTYAVWVKITDSPEVPVKPAGTLAIT